MTDFHYRLQLGIHKPEGDEPTDLNVMRQAINRASRDSNLIRQCTWMADLQGLSGEDRYVLMAYHALRHLQDIWERHADMVERLPMPPMILKPSSDQPGADRG